MATSLSIKEQVLLDGLILKKAKEDNTYMQSNSPARDQKEYDRKIDAIKRCGENRGPHDYIPIAWASKDESKHVTYFMCRICFTRVSMKTLHETFYEARMS